MRVRSTLSIEYNGEVKELDVTFALIDEVSQKVDWALLLEKVGTGSGRPLTDAAKLVHAVMVKAGHNITIDEIYDDMFQSKENEDSYFQLAMKFAQEFTPQGKKSKADSKKNLKQAV